MTLKPLIEEKYPEQDLFICDVADAVLKDIMPQMEHPFYSLSKTPVMIIRRYDYGDKWVEIVPSVKGLPTIYDKDILIYAISQVMAKINQGKQVSKRIRINTHELLKFTNKGTAGKDYKAICEAVTRLGGVQISTNIRTGDIEQYDTFGLIESSSIRRKHGRDGRLLWCDITLSDWVFNAIEKNEVLTLHRDYFRIRKPIERRIYEIARKHCGQKSEWSIGLEKLHVKTGSRSTLKKFRFIFKELAKTNHLPDYLIEFEHETDNVTFRNRQEWWDEKDYNDKPLPRIKHSQTYETARGIAPHGIDIYAIEQEWFDWWKKSDRKDLKDPDRAFLGFVSKKFLSDT